MSNHLHVFERDLDIILHVWSATDLLLLLGDWMDVS